MMSANVSFKIQLLQVLHPNHMFFCLVKYSLSGYYGRLPGFRMEEMTPDVVKRKRQICLETLEVIEKIDLGIGIRKGLDMTLNLIIFMSYTYKKKHIVHGVTKYLSYIFHMRVEGMKKNLESLPCFKLPLLRLFMEHF